MGITLQAKFEYEKGTRNALRFKEVTKGAVPRVGTLYIRREAAGGAGIEEGDSIVVEITKEEK